MIHLGFALENSEMNMKWAHSEKLQLTTSPKNPFPQQNTPWVPNIDVAPRRLEEAFGAAFHAHVDGLEPLSVRWRQHQEDEKTIMFSPYDKPSKKQTHNKSCNSRLKIQSLLIQTLGLWCSSSHVLLKQSWRSPGLPYDDTPESIFRVWFKLRRFPRWTAYRSWICRIQSQSLTWHNMTWYHPKAWLSYCCIWYCNWFLLEENIDPPASHRIVWILASECIWRILRWNTQIPIARKPTVPWKYYISPLVKNPLQFNN